MGLCGGRTGNRVVVAERLGPSGLMAPFDAAIWFGDRVAVLGCNGSGTSHLLRLLAAGGSARTRSLPVGEALVAR